jgi:hypothetical protein
MKDREMIDDDLAGAPGPTLLEYHRLCNARSWVAERLEEAQRHGYTNDVARYRTNMSLLDQKIRALIHHAVDRVPRTEHVRGDDV